MLNVWLEKKKNEKHAFLNAIYLKRTHFKSHVIYLCVLFVFDVLKNMIFFIKKSVSNNFLFSIIYN